MAHFGVILNAKSDIPPAEAELFDDAQAAAYVGGITSRCIRDWRTRRGLPFVRLTAKVIRIRRADLDKWIARHQVAISRGGA
jgi:excisionase family DNA binding protein